MLIVNKDWTYQFKPQILICFKI